ncbi:MAG: MOP flippase family protein [Candidatus Electryonea clarkiae]|nr:MOP flippase family protein [Candidatus Electryonea clarkiae]MDP8287892.1 MOP flippase family protein [Candidatus Electryonea clarkiae]
MKRLTHDVLFNSKYLSKDLARKSIHGGMTIMTAQVIKFVLDTAGTVVLARLLTPEDFGLIVMVTVVVGFAAMFKDAGLSMATIQKDSISHEQISTLFWINIILSTFLGVCVLAASPLVAKFYGRPELTAVTVVLSVSFIIKGLIIQHTSLLRRHMKFRALAVIQITSQIISLVVKIVLALLGWRYWALVGGSITTALTIALLTLFLCPWVPGKMERGAGVRDMLKFGGHLTGFSFVNYFARNLDNMLIGKYLGSQSLGLYSKAYNLLMLPISQINQPISAVAVPALSRLQNEPERYRKYYLKVLSHMTFITLPSVMFMIVMSENIILVLLGEQWIKASPIFSVLGISALVGVVIHTTGWLHISIGRTDRMFKWGAFTSFFIVVSFFIGLPFGAIGVATAYTIVFLLLSPFTLWYACKPTPVRVTGIITALWPTIFATLMVGVALGLLKIFHPNFFVGILGLGVSLVIAVAVYLSVLCVYSRSFEPVRSNINILTQIFPKRTNTGKGNKQC